MDGDKVFEPLIGMVMQVCGDGMIVKSMQDAEHGRDLWGMFEILRRSDMRLCHKKCIF